MCKHKKIRGIRDMFVDFLRATAWQMTPPKAYGAFHLTFFLVGLVVVTLAAYALRKTNERQNRAVLLTVGIALILFEIYKISFRYFVVYDRDMSAMWWLFPFQLCSVPMYLCIIAPLLKKGRLQNALYDFMLAFNLFGGFIAFLEPSGLVHEYWTLTLHAFVWHMVLVFIGLYLGFSGRAGKKLSDYKSAIAVFAVLCAVAFCINLAFYRVSGGSMNNFYIGPANSPIIVFKTICERWGWYVNMPIYMILLCLGAFLFFLLWVLVNRKKEKQ